MIYSIAFISDKQMRDIKLEKILNPDFNIDDYVHEGDFDYIVKLRNNSSDVVINLSQRPSYISHCTKWKTIPTSKRYLEQFKKRLAEKSKRISFRGLSYSMNESDFWKQNYTPVVCDITEKFNSEIKRQIEIENNRHQKKLTILTKKLG